MTSYWVRVRVALCWWFTLTLSGRGFGRSARYDGRHD